HTGNQVDEETTYEYIDADGRTDQSDEDDSDDELEGRRVGGGGGGGGGRGRGGGGGGGGGGEGGRGWGAGGGGGGGGGGGKWASTGGGGSAGGGAPDGYTTHTSYTEASDVATTLQNSPSTANPTTTTKPQTRAPTTQPPPPKPEPAEDVDINCDFGDDPEPNLCSWSTNDDGALQWQIGTGRTSNWLGGPTNDFSTGNTQGGFAFVETSQIPLPQGRNMYAGAILESPLMFGTGPQGSCVQFTYVMDGLSPAELRVLLQTDPPEDPPPSWAHLESTMGNLSDGRLLWQAEYHTNGLWNKAQFLYTCEVPHKLIFEGVPVEVSDPSRLYRGFIAIDKIEQQPGDTCKGYCTFSAGFCDWENEEDEDDFEWSLSRGSRNPVTGPTSDSSPDKIGGGGYAYIESSFPRRPGDMARLISPQFKESSKAICAFNICHVEKSLSKHKREEGKNK
ncbi:hypothetical protein C0J52_10795, partial [Blattella germanica]